MIQLPHILFYVFYQPDDPINPYVTTEHPDRPILRGMQFDIMIPGSDRARRVPVTLGYIYAILGDIIVFHLCGHSPELKYIGVHMNYVMVTEFDMRYYRNICQLSFPIDFDPHVFDPYILCSGTPTITTSRSEPHLPSQNNTSNHFQVDERTLYRSFS